MSNQPIPCVFIEMAFNSNAFFQGSRKGDVCFRTAQSSQSFLFGTQINQPAIFGIDGSNIIMRGNIAIGGQTSNPLEALDIRNGNAYFDSNVYVMNKLCVGATNPDASLHVTNGDAKLNSNLYVIGNASIGITSSNPTETLDIGSNLKVRSNAYIMYRVGVANSNPTETLDITGNVKVANSLYTLSNIAVGSSNPSEAFDVQLNAIVRSNAYVMRRFGIASSNPSEALDVVGNGKITGRLFVTSNVGIGNTNPSERLDVNDNTKLRGDVYAMSRMVVGGGASNPTEVLDVRGNVKVSSNVYITSNLGVGSSTPSEKVDIAGNAKVQSNMYVVNRIGVGLSNPSEKIDVVGNIYSSSNIYSMNNIGVGTVLPNERIEVTGNIKSLSNVYAMSRISVGHSNPTERVDVNGNVKVSSNVYVASRLGVNTLTPTVGLEVHTTDSILLPKGMTSERPSPAVLGHVRYNTDTSQFEGFGAGNAWGSLGGVKSTNQQTYISAEEYPTSNDDNIRFINSNNETMRITREGNVGIGTSNPEYELDVNGLFRFKDPNRNNTITFNSNDNWDGVQLNFSKDGTEMVMGVDESGDAFIKTYGRTALILGANGSESMRLDFNSGFVGINTTNPQHKLEVNGTIFATGYCNLLVDSTSSESTSNAPTAYALKLAADAAFYTSNVLLLGSGGSSVNAVATSASNTAYWSSNNLVKKSGDTMTGTLYTPFVGVNNTSATERLDVTGNIKSSSNIYVMSRLGVGTSNPSTPVHVVGDMRVEGNLNVNGIYNTINTDVQLTDQVTVSNNGTGPALKVYQMGAQPIADFYDDSNIAVRIVDGGSVGIGTGTPAYRLDVNNGDMVVRNGANAVDAGGAYNFGIAAVSNAAPMANIKGVLGNYDSTGSTLAGGITFNVRSNVTPGSTNAASLTEAMRITSLGNVGIGLSAPSYKLDVQGLARVASNVGQGSANALLQIQNGTSNLGVYVNLPQGSYNGCVNTGDYAIIAGLNSVNTGSLTLGSWGDYYAGIHIDKSGYIGVGTNSPSYKLDVNGKLRLTSNIISHGTGPRLQVADFDGSEDQALYGIAQITQNSAGVSTWSNQACLSLVRSGNWKVGLGFAKGSNIFGIGTAQASNVEFSPNLLSITQGGNVGIGIVNPTYNLQIPGMLGARINNVVIGPGIVSEQGAYIAWNRDGSTGYTSYMNQKGTGTGGHIFGEITTGNVFTEYMRLTGSGSLGVGTNNPSYKLEVNGTLNATTIYQGGATLASTYMSFQNAGILSNALTIQEATGSTGSASGGTLTLKHVNSGGASSIVFTSTVNAGSDYAYIRYADQDISTYFPNLTGVTECSRLTIGVENDLDVPSNGETIVIKGGFGIAYDSVRHFFTGGNVSIGNYDASGYKLYVQGQIYASDDITAFSDITAKSNLEIIEDPLNKVAQLSGYTYDMIKETPTTTKITPRYTGIIAQDLEKVLPEAVHKDPNGKLSVAYGNMAGLFVESIKELSSQNKQLTQENQDLKSQLRALATKVAEIEKRFTSNY